MGLAKCAGTKISYNGTLPQSLSRWQKLKKTITINVNKKHFKVLSSRTQEIN